MPFSVIIDRPQTLTLGFCNGDGDEGEIAYRARGGELFPVDEVEYEDAEHAYLRLAWPGAWVLELPAAPRDWRPLPMRSVSRTTTEAETNSPYVDYRAAAAYCRCEVKTLQNAKSRGELAAVPGGAGVRFERSELDRWMQKKSQKNRR
jgi:hypothetical protein